MGARLEVSRCRFEAGPFSNRIAVKRIAAQRGMGAKPARGLHSSRGLGVTPPASPGCCTATAILLVRGALALKVRSPVPRRVKGSGSIDGWWPDGMPGLDRHELQTGAAHAHHLTNPLRSKWAEPTLPRRRFSGGMTRATAHGFSAGRTRTARGLLLTARTRATRGLFFLLRSDPDSKIAAGVRQTRHGRRAGSRPS